jgi:hypothetical protein
VCLSDLLLLESELWLIMRISSIEALDITKTCKKNKSDKGNAGFDRGQKK